MATSIAGDEELAKELVQEMFIKLCEKEKKEGNLNGISYQGKNKPPEINTYFCYRMLQNAFVDIMRQNKRKPNKIDIDEISEAIQGDLSYEVSETEYDYQEAKESLLDEVESTLKDLHWYDALLFKEYHKDEKSVRELAKRTGISRISIYNTLRNVRTEIKENTRPSKIKDYRDKKSDIGE